MTASEIRSRILIRLGNIAPEVDPAQLAPTVAIREQVDIDSMDFLNFMIALHKEFGTEIPERDYSQMQTLDGCVKYVTRAIDASARSR